MLSNFGRQGLALGEKVLNREMAAQKMSKHTLVLIRHGESLWNEKNLFTGWYDVGLSEKGIVYADFRGAQKYYRF